MLIQMPWLAVQKLGCKGRTPKTHAQLEYQVHAAACIDPCMWALAHLHRLASATSIWQQPRRSPDLGGCNQEEGARTDSKVQLYSNAGTNAVQRTEPLSEYSRLCALLVPLCMPRAVEETFYGPAQVSLATAPYVRSLPCRANIQALAGVLLSLGSAQVSLATVPNVRSLPRLQC